MYELSNHPGNVLTTVSDIKLTADGDADGVVDSYAAVITSAQDYYPFGSLETDRTYSSDNYRFGFNGQEMDNEISGQTGTHTTAMFWEYDTRLGRRWNLDPKPQISMSDYACFANNPVWFCDVNGDNYNDRINRRINRRLDKIDRKVKRAMNKDNTLSVEGAYKKVIEDNYHKNWMIVRVKESSFNNRLGGWGFYYIPNLIEIGTSTATTQNGNLIIESHDDHVGSTAEMYVYEIHPVDNAITTPTTVVVSNPNPPGSNSPNGVDIQAGRRRGSQRTIAFDVIVPPGQSVTFPLNNDDRWISISYPNSNSQRNAFKPNVTVTGSVTTINRTWHEANLRHNQTQANRRPSKREIFENYEDDFYNETH